MLSDGHLELSNNIAEQGQRIFVVGRKNWLFSDTPRGAHASAAIYSIMTTARANGLSPRKYVEWLFDEMPNAGELTDDVVDRFLPWSSNVPDKCLFPESTRAKAMEVKDDPLIDIDPYLLDDEMKNNQDEAL
ncbi:MAG: transposase [Raoultibacter sp.]